MKMRAFALVLFAPILLAQTAADKPMLGFSAASATKEQALEAQFDAKLNRDELRDWLRRLSARPHHLGSAADKQNAELIASMLKSWGYDTNIEEFTVLFPTPKSRLVELIAPEKYTLKLAEPPLPQDSTSGQTSEQLPTYNAYSIDGDVTGDLVYVNYGVPDDYDILERNGVDVKGKIVIARYGGSWRGIKPKVAAEHGAVGCIIYSDPRDDGYYQGDVYPKGAYRSDMGAQRGSVMDMPTHPGDPLAMRPASSPRSRSCRSPTATRCRCCARSAGRWRRPTGAARCRSPITSAPARRACTWRWPSTGSSCRHTTSSPAWPAASVP